MGINTIGTVGNNLLAIAVVSLVLFWVYKNMEDTSFKRWLSDFFERIKEAVKDGK